MQRTCSAHVDQLHEWGVWPACRSSSNSVHQRQSIVGRLQRSHQAPCPLLRPHSRRHVGSQRRHRLQSASCAASGQGHRLTIDVGDKQVRNHTVSACPQQACAPSSSKCCLLRLQLTLETGEIGRQANGAVMVKSGDTVSESMCSLA